MDGQFVNPSSPLTPASTFILFIRSFLKRFTLQTRFVSSRDHCTTRGFVQRNNYYVSKGPSEIRYTVLQIYYKKYARTAADFQSRSPPGTSGVRAVVCTAIDHLAVFACRKLPFVCLFFLYFWSRRLQKCNRRREGGDGQKRGRRKKKTDLKIGGDRRRRRRRRLGGVKFIRSKYFTTFVFLKFG